MKRKNKYNSLLAIFTILFTTSILANQQTNTPMPPDIEEQFGQIFEYTPAQICTYSIKSFFQECHFTDYYQTRNVSRSKTAIFNQSLVCYVKEVYNSRQYPQLISQDGTHIVEFLELSSELNLNIQSLYTCIRLFHNKMKECEIIDDTVIIQILKPLPYLIGEHFDIKEAKPISSDKLSKSIEKILLFKFTDHLQEFQDKPDPFLTELANEITEHTQKEFAKYKKAINKGILLERLRQTIIRFFENTLDKLVWDATTYEGIWQSVITIANSLQQLGNNGIIDHMDDLDDLLWSLTQRFCYFLELDGSSLPLSFYEEIETDLYSKVVDFLEAKELDEGIKTKKVFITEALMKAKAKAFAFEKKGIFTDQML